MSKPGDQPGSAARAALADLVRPGARVALGDGAGTPISQLAALSAAARDAGGVRLMLGWCPGSLDDLQTDAFADVATLMAGYGLRKLVDGGAVRYLPVRLGSVPALVREVVRPDVLVASVVRHDDGWRFATEVSWMCAAVEAGAVVAAVERPALPAADRGPVLPADRVVVVARDPSPAIAVDWGRPRPEHRMVAAHAARLVPKESRVQYGPGLMGTAVLEAMEVPIAVDTGIVTEAVVELDRRGLLVGTPIAPYLAGSTDLYEWADGRPILASIEVTHDAGRLGGDPPLVAVNTAIEIDVDGQVNVESTGGSAVAGIGGHPDYAFAAARAVGGLSIVALPSSHRGRPTLVDRLSAPVSTPSHDIDVVVTERGAADLRGLDRAERRHAIGALWNE
jgi:acyl-CoA hydrolase